MIRPALLVALLVAASHPTLARDWSQFQWMDDLRITTDSAWNDSWSTDGPPVTWRSRIGHGYSAVSVANGMIYTMGYDARNSQDVVYAMDAATGEEHWSYRYDCLPVSNLHKGGPSATPLVHEGRVYTLSKEGHLFAFRADSGEVLWSHDLREALGVEVPFCGFSNSPMVVNGQLIIDAGVVAALDPRTGDIRWKTRSYEPQYAAPGLFEQDGRTILASMNGEGLLLIDADTGEEITLHPVRLGQRNAFCNTPVYHDQSLLIAGQGTLGLIKLDVSDLNAPTELWTRRDLENLFNQPVLLDDRLYVHAREKELHCLDYETGEDLWTSDLLNDGPFIFANGQMLAISGLGELILADVTPEGLQPLGRKQLFGGNCWTPPVLSNGMIFARNENGDLVALRVRS